MGGRLAIVTMLSGKFAEVAGDVSHNRITYAERHGYSAFCVSGRIAPDYCPIWDRHHFTRELLESYEWVFWLDADSIIMKTYKPLKPFLSSYYDIVAGGEAREPKVNLFNCGNLFFHSSDWTKKFLERWVSEARRDEKYDQPVLWRLMRKDQPIRKHIKIHYPCSFNRIYMPNQTNPKDAFIVHYAGMQWKERAARIIWSVRNTVDTQQE